MVSKLDVYIYTFDHETGALSNGFWVSYSGGKDSTI